MPNLSGVSRLIFCKDKKKTRIWADECKKGSKRFLKSWITSLILNFLTGECNGKSEFRFYRHEKDRTVRLAFFDRSIGMALLLKSENVNVAMRRDELTGRKHAYDLLKDTCSGYPFVNEARSAYHKKHID